MKSRLLTLLLASLGLFLGGCSTISDAVDAVNPFSSSAAKIAPLPAFTASLDARTVWAANIGKAGDYTFVPAVVGNAAYVAARDGAIAKFEDGKQVWKISAGQVLSAGVGANRSLVVVGTPKGDLLAFSADDGKPLWQAKLSSELLAAPVVGDSGIAVRSGDNRVAMFDFSGMRKWVYQRATPSLSVRGVGVPVFADQYVFVGFPGGKVVALSLQNGAPVWEGVVALPKGATELDRVADVVATPVVDGRQLCAVAFQGRVA